MNVAFVGFDDYPEQKEEIEEIISKTTHIVVNDPTQAQVLMVPHHMDGLFPVSTPWIAVWIKGSSARVLDLYWGILKNKPYELITGWKPRLILDNQQRVLINALNKIEQVYKAKGK